MADSAEPTSGANRPGRAPRDVRPWELPGNVRRDCEPHRAPLLAVLGGVALVCGFLAFLFAVPAVIALPLGLAVRRMGEHDLHAMRWGRMNPAGRAGTIRAQVWATGAVALSLFCWVPVAVVFLLRS